MEGKKFVWKKVGDYDCFNYVCKDFPLVKIRKGYDGRGWVVENWKGGAKSRFAAGTLKRAKECVESGLYAERFGKFLERESYQRLLAECERFGTSMTAVMAFWEGEAA